MFIAMVCNSDNNVSLGIFLFLDFFMKTFCSVVSILSKNIVIFILEEKKQIFLNVFIIYSQNEKERHCLCRFEHVCILHCNLCILYYCIQDIKFKLLGMY